MCVRGETFTVGNFSPHPDSSWSHFLTTSEHFPLVLPLLLPCCPVLSQLLSALAQSHFSLPWATSTSSFLLSFTLWFWVRFSVPAQTAERKDGPEVRVTAWAGESHIQFSLPLTPPLTLGFVFHTSFCPPLPSSKYCSEIFMFYLWTSIKHSKHPELDVSHQPLQKKKILPILAGCLSLGETAILPSPTARLGQVSPSLPKGQHCSSIPRAQSGRWTCRGAAVLPQGAPKAPGARQSWKGGTGPPSPSQRPPGCCCWGVKRKRKNATKGKNKKTSIPKHY